MAFPNAMGMLAGGGRTARTSTSGGGRTAFGTVPSSIATPASLYSQLGAIPGFTANTGGAGSVIGSELSGQVSPQTLNALKTAAAQFGVASGMPGSGLETNQLFGNIAGFSEARQRQGVQDYLAETGTLGRLQTDPGLAAEIAARNADLAAAPDPRLAHQQQIDDYLKAQSTAFALANPSRGPWWAQQIGAGGTVHSNYGGMGGAPPGGVGVGAFGSPDAFGYNFTNPEAGYGPNLVATTEGVFPAGDKRIPRSWSTAPPSMANFYPGLQDEGPYGPIGVNSGEEDYVPDYPGQ